MSVRNLYVGDSNGRAVGVFDELASRVLLTDTLRGAEVIEGKNLIPTPYLTSTRSHRGISFVENADGSVGFSGTPNDVLAFYVLNIIKLKAGTYVLSDGDTTAYGGIWAGFYDDANCTVKYSGTSTGLIVDGSSASISTTQNGTINVANNNTWGYPKEFTIGQDCYVQLCARAGNQNYYSTNQSGTIYPMLCTKEEWDKSHEYKPYYEPLKDRKLDIRSYMATGSVNRCPNTGATATINGVTWTVNSDGTVTANSGGQPASANSFFDFSINGKVPSGAYRFVACPPGGSASTYGASVKYTTGSPQWSDNDTGDGVELLESKSLDSVRFYVLSGVTVNNKIFRPMISDARLNLHYEDYVPYAMTNKELTDKTDQLSSAFLDQGILDNTSDLDNVLTQGLYHITSKPAHSPEQWSPMMVYKRSNSDVRQVIYGSNNSIFVRVRGGSPAYWDSWYKFEGTIVS